MFFKKNYENLAYLFTFTLIIIFYLYSKNSLFSHWSDILDQDVTLIYNSLLIASDPQEYLDHPAFTTIFILNIFYKIGYILNIVDVKNLNELLNHPDKDSALQSVHNFSQFIHFVYALILILIFKKIINKIFNNNLSSFFLSLIFLISPSFIFLFDIIRSEILSLILIFLFYTCLENSLKKNIFFIILSGVFFVCSMLAKVQVILCLFPILITFIINNIKIKNSKKIYISSTTKLITNIIIVIFLVAVIDNFFYKRIDKIFFILIVLFLIFAFSIPEKKLTGQKTTNIIFLLFLVGCSITLLGFKFLSKIGLIYFHPALIDIITSPISQMSNISTGYGIGRSDNFEYIFKIKKFFFEVLSNHEDNKLRFLFNKFNILSYLISFSFMVYFLKKKEYLKTILVLFLTTSIVSLVLVFNFRPYFFYDIYILPLNLILISVLIKEIPHKKILTFAILIIYISFNLSNIKAGLNEKRNGGFFKHQAEANNSMKHICKENEILKQSSYMRYWHKKYSADFLRELCISYYKKINLQ